MVVFLWEHTGVSVTVDYCIWFSSLFFSDCSRMPPRFTLDSAGWCKLSPDCHVWCWKLLHFIQNTKTLKRMAGSEEYESFSFFFWYFWAVILPHWNKQRSYLSQVRFCPICSSKCHSFVCQLKSERERVWLFSHEINRHQKVNISCTINCYTATEKTAHIHTFNNTSQVHIISHLDKHTHTNPKAHTRT